MSMHMHRHVRHIYMHVPHVFNNAMASNLKCALLYAFHCESVHHMVDKPFNLPLHECIHTSDSNPPDTAVTQAKCCLQS